MFIRVYLVTYPHILARHLFVVMVWLWLVYLTLTLYLSYTVYTNQNYYNILYYPFRILYYNLQSRLRLQH